MNLNLKQLTLEVLWSCVICRFKIHSIDNVYYSDSFVSLFKISDHLGFFYNM